MSDAICPRAPFRICAPRKFSTILLAILPIGDNYTMGPEDALRAVEFIQPSRVIPCHYNTFPPIQQDPHAFASAVGDQARVDVMEPGDTLDL